MIMKLLGWLGMALSIVSYALTVNGMPTLGVPMAAVGCCVYGFYAYKTRIWNLFTLQLVFLGVNISGMIHLFL